MDIKEAYKQLEFMAINLTGQLANCKAYERRRVNVIVDRIEAIGEAQKALKKQLPMIAEKVDTMPSYRRYGLRYACPKCKTEVRDYEKFCKKCGQALKYKIEKS